MNIDDKEQFITIWYKECMDRGLQVLDKINSHDYIMEEPQEETHSGSPNANLITIEERIDIFKYFLDKYEGFDRSMMCNYLFMTEFLNILHPQEFPFTALYQDLNEQDGQHSDDESILRELLLHINKFFSRRNLKAKPGYLKDILSNFDQESSYFLVLEIIFTIAFMSKDVYSLLDYPKEFFNSSLSSLSESYNPVSFGKTMHILNSVLNDMFEVKENNTDFIRDPMKRDTCIISPRAPIPGSDESGSTAEDSENPLVKFNKQFTLHIKNETLESEEANPYYDQDEDDMCELDWLRLNNATEEEYLDMLDQKEEEHKQKIIEAREQELRLKHIIEERNAEKEYSSNLQEICDKQKAQIKALLDKVYKKEKKEIDYKSDIDIIRGKASLREEEIKNLNKKLLRLEKFKLQCRDKDEEIAILNSHLDEMNSSHSYAMEKVQSLSRELDRERNLSKKFKHNFNPYSSPDLEENSPEEFDRSVDFSSERGNLMNESSILEQDSKERHQDGDTANLTLEDELGMLGLEGDNFENNDIFEPRQALYSLHDDQSEVELCDISPEAPFPTLEEKKYSPYEESKTARNLNNAFCLSKDDGIEVSLKDVRIADLEKKVEIEKEMKENYYKKYTEYMTNFIKAEKRRKEIEVYLGIKKRQQSKMKKIVAVLIPVIFLLVAIYFMIG
ncbi:unnamed protein product [Moneuplotes crassus]|uniref:Uncharacterized protein n=1 Tax=Euplotes crassus TaxID=5936 RepID=A0AAD1X677_EUPCR|nr:unnamed protein product [Moneuplotes crassus]